MNVHIVEVAEITASDPAGFEAAVAQARPHFLVAEGCLGLSLHRVEETPQVYRLLVKWRRIEDHMETFRASEGFRHWRALASPFFASPPKVAHSAAVDLG